MYSKEQLIKALEKEIKILEHLYTKVTPAYYNHQFTSEQRTIKELLAYIAASPWKQVALICTGDMGVFADMKEYTESFACEDFVATLHKNSADAMKYIQDIDAQSLAEEVVLFGGFARGTRGELFVEMVLGQLIAYKMQLFLQLKHAGCNTLKSTNLWVGSDPK